MIIFREMIISNRQIKGQQQRGQFQSIDLQWCYAAGKNQNSAFLSMSAATLLGPKLV